jgi:hypothetical protein
MRETECMRRRAVYLCLSLVGACVGPGLEPPDRGIAHSSAGSRASADTDSKAESGAAARGAPGVTAPTTPPATGTNAPSEQDAGAKREEDAGTDDSGVEP